MKVRARPWPQSLNDKYECRASRSLKGFPHESEEHATDVASNRESDAEATIPNRKSDKRGTEMPQSLPETTISFAYAVLTPLKLDELTKLDITCMQKEQGYHLKSEGDTRDGKKRVELTNLVTGEIEPDDS